MILRTPSQHFNCTNQFYSCKFRENCTPKSSAFTTIIIIITIMIIIIIIIIYYNYNYYYNYYYNYNHNYNHNYNYELPLKQKWQTDRPSRPRLLASSSSANVRSALPLRERVEQSSCRSTRHSEHWHLQEETEDVLFSKFYRVPDTELLLCCISCNRSATVVLPSVFIVIIIIRRVAAGVVTVPIKLACSDRWCIRRCHQRVFLDRLRCIDSGKF